VAGASPEIQQWFDASGVPALGEEDRGDQEEHHDGVGVAVESGNQDRYGRQRHHPGDVSEHAPQQGQSSQVGEGTDAAQPEPVSEKGQCVQNRRRMNKCLALREPASRRIVLNAGAVQLGKTGRAESKEILLPGTGVVGSGSAHRKKNFQQTGNDASQYDPH